MIVLPIFRGSTRTARFPSHRQQCDIGTRTSRGRCRQLSKDFSCQIWNCSRSGINRMNIDYPGTSCRGFCGVHLCHQHGQETVKSDNHEKVHSGARCFDYSSLRFGFRFFLPSFFYGAAVKSGGRVSRGRNQLLSPRLTTSALSKLIPYTMRCVLPAERYF